MFIYKAHLYFTYILTNPERTVLYTGVTNNLEPRLAEHYFNRGDRKTFAGRFYCYNLVYFEEFQYVNNAIAREKEIKGWRRSKKEALIKTKNPNWTFLNKTVCRCWPPKENRIVSRSRVFQALGDASTQTTLVIPTQEESQTFPLSSLSCSGN